jgi:hypothetical protein
MKINDSTYNYISTVLSIKEKTVLDNIITKEEVAEEKELSEMLQTKGLPELPNCVVDCEIPEEYKDMATDIIKKIARRIELHNKPHTFIDSLTREIYAILDRIGLDGVSYYCHKRQNNGYLAVYIGILPRYAGYLEFLEWCRLTGHRGWFTREDTPAKRAFVKWSKERKATRVSIMK